MLQACVTESSIRHAAIAIGALGKAYEISQVGPSPIDGSRLVLDSNRFPAPGSKTSPGSAANFKSETLVKEAFLHHRQALEQYEKAIKRMRNDIADGNQNIRTTLIICIIIICFEAIHGNHESAAGQLQSGLALIHDWKDKQPNADKHPQGFSSPAPDVVEDFLVQTFGRMEIQSMSVFDPRGAEVHQVLKKEGKETIEKMPKQFSTIEEARVYLDLITRRLMHFNSSIHKTQCSPSSSRESTPPKPYPAAPYPQMPDAIPSIEGKIPMENTQHLRSSRALLSEQGSLNTELTAWKEAFRPLLIYARAAGGQGAISALTMTISAISSSISLRAAFFMNESAYDIFMPEFRIIVDYTRILVGVQQSQAKLAKIKDEVPGNGNFSGNVGPMIHFAFDIGVVPPLYLVMVKCRDPKLRREALSLLEQNPKREGVWDSVACVALGRWVISLEEEGARSLLKARLNPRPPTTQASKSESPSTIGGYESELDDSSNIRGASTQASQSSQSYGRGILRQTPFSPIDAAINIPEEVRVKKAKMRFNLLERRANLSCIHMDLTQGFPVPKNATFTW